MASRKKPRSGASAQEAALRDVSAAVEYEEAARINRSAADYMYYGLDAALGDIDSALVTPEMAPIQRRLVKTLRCEMSKIEPYLTDTRPCAEARASRAPKKGTADD